MWITACINRFPSSKATFRYTVVRVTAAELILAQRKLDGTWGIQARQPLQSTPALLK